MTSKWRWWWLASVAVHAALVSVASRAAPARAAARVRSTVQFDVAPPTVPPPVVTRNGLPSDRDAVGGEQPLPEGHLGGARSAQNVSADTAGERGDGRSLDRGQVLAARAEGVNLDARLFNTFEATQEQRIRTSRERASPQDDRRTPNPDADPWLATGDGVLLFRAPRAAAMPDRGVSARAGVGRLAGQAVVLQPEGLRGPPPPPVVPGGRPRPSAGVADDLHGRAHRTAGPVARGRPPVEQGHASTTADRAELRPSDNMDATLLAASLLRAHVNATVQDGPRRGEGVGGVGGGGAPGSGGGVGRGGRAQAFGDGDGWLSLTSSDARYELYFHEVNRRLHPLWADAFPRDEALQLRQGTVIIRFVITRDGRVRGAHIRRRSGVDRFDQNVLVAVAGARLPPIPPSLGAEELRVVAPFQLRNPIVR